MKTDRHFIDLLREHGLGRHVALPQIAVVGDQSAGKSSVLSAVAEVVEFPSGSTLTTRCATQVSLTKSEEEEGVVYLLRNGTNERAFEESFTDLSLVREKIASIQKELPEQFSEDVIVIKLSSPKVPGDLTIIDLPGIIRNVSEGQDPALIGKIRSIVERFVRQERTVILAVLAGNVDLANSEIITMAREVDPNLERTLPVITKLDLMDPGTELEFLRSANDTLLPFHWVKCRSALERQSGLTSEQAHQKERALLEKPVFRDNVAAEFRGVPALQTRLERLLADRIRSELPKVLQETRALTESTKTNLNALGPDLSSPSLCRSHVTSVVSKIESLVNQMIRGQYDDLEFFAAMENRARSIIASKEITFRDTMLQLPLMSSVLEEGEIITIEETESTVHQDQAASFASSGLGFGSSFGHAGQSPPADAAGGGGGDVRGGFGSQSTPVKAGIGFDTPSGFNFDPSKLNFDTSDEGRAAEAVKQECALGEAVVVKEEKGVVYFRCAGKGPIYQRRKKKVTIDFDRVFRRRLQRRIAQSRGMELPGFLPFSTFTSLVRMEIQRWEAPTSVLVGDVFSLLEQSFATVVTEACNNAPRAALNFFQTQLVRFLGEAKDGVRTSLNSLFAAEATPSTKNHYFSDLVARSRFDDLQKSIADFPDEVSKEVVEALLKEAVGIGKKSNEEYEADEMYRYLKAYVKLARKRFVDNVCQKINLNIFGTIAKVGRLASDLTDARLMSMFRESESDRLKRKQLSAKLESLEKAMALFENYTF